MKKKLLPIGLCAICAVVITVSFGFRCGYPMTSEERVIKITARKFDFSPAEIKVKKAKQSLLNSLHLTGFMDLICPILN
jgi:hypothetical protein